MQPLSHNAMETYVQLPADLKTMIDQLYSPYRALMDVCIAELDKNHFHEKLRRLPPQLSIHTEAAFQIAYAFRHEYRVSNIAASSAMILLCLTPYSSVGNTFHEDGDYSHWLARLQERYDDNLDITLSCFDWFSSATNTYVDFFIHTASIRQGRKRRFSSLFN